MCIRDSCIAAEGPMVPDNYNIFYNRGIRVITVPMEEDGMRMDVLEEVLREKKPKFIYTLPNYHNPTGITMSLKKRETLLRLATAYNIPIIEEDYQMDFTYDGPRLPSLYTLDTNRQVIYLYSFTPVSYTHLDVYKRQSAYWWPVSCSTDFSAPSIHYPAESSAL